MGKPTSNNWACHCCISAIRGCGVLLRLRGIILGFHCCMCCVTLLGWCNCFWVVIVACVALFQLPAISLGGMRAVRGLTPTCAVTFNLRRHKSASACYVYSSWDWLQKTLYEQLNTRRAWIIKVWFIFWISANTQLILYNKPTQII